MVEEETNSNWSSGLNIRDRLHGALRQNVPQREITIGVAAYQDPDFVTLRKIVPLLREQRPAWMFAEQTKPQLHEEWALVVACYRDYARVDVQVFFTTTRKKDALRLKLHLLHRTVAEAPGFGEGLQTLEKRASRRVCAERRQALPLHLIRSEVEPGYGPKSVYISENPALDMQQPASGDDNAQ